MDSQLGAKNRLQEIVSTQQGVALCWLGNLGWLIYADGTLIATDLDLDREGRIQPSPIPTGGDPGGASG